MNWKAFFLGLGSTLLFLGIGTGVYFSFFSDSSLVKFVSPLGEQIQEQAKPLEKYTFENLSQIDIEKSQIVLEEVIEDKSEFTAHLFAYESEGKKITGQINIPKSRQPKDGFPIILMLRGYIPPETYETGDGTRSAAAVFAKNGFVTVAPDFLGHGGSDNPDINTLAARVKRPYNLLVLLNSLSSLDSLDHSLVSIWGHSNGGQLALSLLEITGENYPTTLWAPVSKPFPYSVLYYTDEFEDYGKALRKAIAEFEKDYNVDNYSIHKHYDRINAPIQIHQGTADDAVPKDWSDELNQQLTKLDKDVKYFVYSGADHNLKPSWNTVVQRDISFFIKHL